MMHYDYIKCGAINILCNNNKYSSTITITITSSTICCVESFYFFGRFAICIMVIVEEEWTSLMCRLN